ncbi:MAG: threonyl-tRNA synthetase editing domain-containing protein, partial [Candidatus Anstonellales archaeon]
MRLLFLHADSIYVKPTQKALPDAEDKAEQIRANEPLVVFIAVEENDENIEERVVNEIIDVVELLKMLAEKKALKIETNLPEENVIVKADQYSLNGIISNLLSNAIKYSEKGTISINLWQDNKYAICEIKDEGIGMSDEF